MYSLRQNTLGYVLAAHIGVILVTLCFSKTPAKIQQPKKVIVNTKMYSPPPRVETVKKQVVKTAPPKPQTKTAPRKKMPPPVKKKVTQQPSMKAHNLLRELESKMTNIESNLSQVKQDSSWQPKDLKIQPLVQLKMSEDVENAPNYFESIAGIFKQSLKLPESGAVELTITVQPNGEIGKLETVSSNSALNLRYLEKALKHIRLPKTPDEKALTVTVTFCENN